VPPVPGASARVPDETPGEAPARDDAGDDAVRDPAEAVTRQPRRAA
jgi:hypothetical protein